MNKVAFAENGRPGLDVPAIPVFATRGLRIVDLPHRLVGWVVVSEDDYGDTYRETGVFYPHEYEFAKDDCKSMIRRLRPRNEVKVMALVEVTTELIKQGETEKAEHDREQEAFLKRMRSAQ